MTTFNGHAITSDWEVSHLLQISEKVTGVFKSSQKLYHAGRELTAGSTICTIIGVAESQLPNRFAVHVIVDEEFARQRLEPFSLIPVPLGPQDFAFPKSVRSGFHWIMKNEAVERHGVRSMTEAQATAQCSPVHPVTLSVKEREAVGIPPAATEFCWSNPVANWEQVEHDPHFLEDWAKCSEGSMAVKDFFVAGGFIFLDDKQNIVQVTTPWLSADKQGSLQFSNRRNWDPLWTKALIGDGRFHRVTTGPLKQAGAQLFCWLLPGEVLEDRQGVPLQRQPEIPHGGFAYLFHDMCSTSPQDLSMDCYFAITSVAENGPIKIKTRAPVGDEKGSDLVGHASGQLHSQNKGAAN